MKNTKNSVSETGHSKNIANLQDLISFCTAYGNKYNPVKEELKISSLESLYQDALLKLNEAQTKKTLFDNATNQRAEVFKELNPLATKVVNALAVSETNLRCSAMPNPTTKNCRGEQKENRKPGNREKKPKTLQEPSPPPNKATIARSITFPI